MTEAVRQIVNTVSAYDPAADVGLIERCFDFAAERHAGQRRRSGEPYVVHPVGVARIISDLRLDVSSVCAGLLHDCVEDTSATAEDIGRLFGQEIQFLVEGVTKLGQIPWTTREERQAENFRKMLLAMARDIRVILIKLADRVDNMRTLQYMSREKQERIARETLEIYAPLANRLGIQWMKIELEDLAFRYVEPQAYADLLAKMTGGAESREAYITEVVDKLNSVLRENEIKGEVSGRAKHLWSIYQKLKKTGRDVEQIYDIIAFRVTVDSIRDCYAVLGVVHSTWTPIPGRFKDFIALPKPNLYQSLHTTVIGPRSDRMEVQIRTHEMHRIAEHRGPLEIQREGTHRRLRWSGLRLAAAVDGVAARSEGSDRVHRDRQDRSVPGRGVRLHSQGGREGLTQGLDAHRLRVCDSLEGGRALLGRAGQRLDRAAALRAQERRHR